jgi:hypothetical protein
MAGGRSKGVSKRVSELPGMPEPFELRLEAVGQTVMVSYGGSLLAVYDAADRATRNVTIVALTRAGRSGVEIGELFGIRPEHVSRLRRLADEGGAAALVPARGRPLKLSPAALKRLYAMADDGMSGVDIATALGVSAATISRRLAQRPQSVAEALDLADTSDVSGDDDTDDGTDKDTDEETDDTDTEIDTDTGTETETETDTDDTDKDVDIVADTYGTDDIVTGHDTEGPPEETDERSIEKIVSAERDCAYAGAMLLHGFFERAGAGAVLQALPSGTARRYDAASLMLCTTFGFALGASSAEGTKHLLVTDAGALVGLDSFPHLRTLRPRLGALADLVDPIDVQVALAQAMFDADEDYPELYFVDDHFVAYCGSQPVPKGWNTRRRLAEPGRDDTVVVDDTWRAVCFTSQAPSGLSKTMWGPIDQLQRICGERPITIGFDRGGSYPKVFAELDRRGIDWITYRRAPLAVPTVLATRSWVEVDGNRRYLRVADETVTLEDVGPVRQITVFEHGRVVLQILTSDFVTPAARLALRLRHRWCIENGFKYLEDHNGIHWLCDYRMDLARNEAKVANPARKDATRAHRAARDVVAELEKSIGALATTRTQDLTETNRTLAELTDRLAAARETEEAAKSALRQVPAKLPANEIDPDATVATPRTNRRHLQMVCRLLAYNAELDLARALDAYLADPDEYRSITRHLLQQPGSIAYSTDAVVVTIRRPDAPRIARALQLLTDQLNATPPRIAGDRRPITYRIGPKP